MSHNCNFCNKPNVSLRCSQCSQYYYCSKQCQVSDWKQGHKKICKKLMEKKKATSKCRGNDKNIGAKFDCLKCDEEMSKIANSKSMC